ncbi:hypothetical protein ACTHGU_00855 [Chitinophagaceae bacterium MMS25-I14]
MPAALFGTLWFSGQQSEVDKVTSKEEAIEERISRKANNFPELLASNTGKPVVITTNDGKSYEGIFEDYKLPDDAKNPLMIKEETERMEVSESRYSITSGTQPMLTLKITNKYTGGASKWISIDPAAIKTIEFDTKPADITTRKSYSVKPVIKVHFSKDGNQDLNMMYLQNGISWAPVYMMELLSETEAHLKLQAEVTNDAEDIHNTDMNFVVGVPNFAYAGSPATLTAFLTLIPPPPGLSANFSNSAIPAQGLSNAVPAEYAPNPENTGETQNKNVEAAEDLYFYNIKNTDLEKGSRAHFTLFNTNVSIRHRYECDLTSPQNSTHSFDTRYNNVYHSIEVRNNTSYPFTTGPVLIMQNGKPLAQDLIKYTGKGLSSFIKLTESPDIRVEEKEEVTDTKTGYTVKHGNSYNLVTMQCEVTIINTKSKDADMAISKTIQGKCTSSEVPHKSRSSVRVEDVNPTETLKFNLIVKAGETKKFTYTYETYVNN